MNSNVILRRAVAARQAVRLRILASPNASRSYSTPSGEEPDPQLNGYPQLPWVSRQTLPPLGWQDNLMRRNFGDTLHEQEEVLSMWGPDPAPIDPYTALRHFSIAISAIAAVGFSIKTFLVPEPPAVRRQYPFDGLVKELGGLDENKARIETINTEE